LQLSDEEETTEGGHRTQVDERSKEIPTEASGAQGAGLRAQG